jgi:uncharacterized membrane protein
MRIRETMQRAFSSFLALPTLVIGIFALLAFGSYSLEQAEVSWLRPARDFMQEHVFGNAQATSTLLGTIAAGLITITSITFSLLLLALQQSASSLTHQVFDQFLRRRLNQVYFGFFVGIALFTLITLATVSPPFNPVFGASLALVLAIVAMYVLLLLIYSTINQMRPTEILKTIHDHTLRSRVRQGDLINQTRRSPRNPSLPARAVISPADGFVVGVDIAAIDRALDRLSGSPEVAYLVSIGAYVAFQDPIAEIRAAGNDSLGEIEECVANATRIGRERNLDFDPVFGIEQLTTIAWRSISTSQQNPAPGIAAIQNLRDLLARWSQSDNGEPGDDSKAIVYPDNVMSSLFDALESLAVVASEAMQHQTYATILRAIETTFERIPAPDQQRTEELLLRTLPALGDHVLTAELDGALTGVENTLERSGRISTASAVRAAHLTLAESVGRLHSRSTRVPTARP